MQNTVRWRSDQLDGAVVRSFLGTLWSNEVMQIRQRETTHEICCLAAELRFEEFLSNLLDSTFQQEKFHQTSCWKK